MGIIIYLRNCVTHHWLSTHLVQGTWIGVYWWVIICLDVGLQIWNTVYINVFCNNIRHCSVFWTNIWFASTTPDEYRGLYSTRFDDGTVEKIIPSINYLSEKGARRWTNVNPLVFIRSCYVRVCACIRRCVCMYISLYMCVLTLRAEGWGYLHPNNTTVIPPPVTLTLVVLNLF